MYFRAGVGWSVGWLVQIPAAHQQICTSVVFRTLLLKPAFPSSFFISIVFAVILLSLHIIRKLSAGGTSQSHRMDRDPFRAAAADWDDPVCRPCVLALVEFAPTMTHASAWIGTFGEAMSDASSAGAVQLKFQLNCLHPEAVWGTSQSHRMDREPFRAAAADWEDPICRPLVVAGSSATPQRLSYKSRSVGLSSASLVYLH